MPAEDPNYDVITGLPWQPTAAVEGAVTSSRWGWPTWGKRKAKDMLPLHATEEEQQPLLKQHTQSRCPDCAAPRDSAYRHPFVRHPALPPMASASKHSAAAAAGTIAGHETLASFRPCGPLLLSRWCEGSCSKGEGASTKPLPFLSPVSLGFCTRGRIDFEDVTVAYRYADISLVPHYGRAIISEHDSSMRGAVPAVLPPDDRTVQEFEDLQY